MVDLLNGNVEKSAGLAHTVKVICCKQIGILGVSRGIFVSHNRKLKLLCSRIGVLYLYVNILEGLGDSGNVELRFLNAVIVHKLFKYLNIAVSLNRSQVSNVKLHLSNEALLGFLVDVHFVDVFDKLEAAVLADSIKILAFLSKMIRISLTDLGVDLSDISLEHIVRSVILILVDLFKENHQLGTGHSVHILGQLGVILNLEICNSVVNFLDVGECYLGDKVAVRNFLLDGKKLLKIKLGDISAELIKLALLEEYFAFLELSGRCLVKLGIKSRLALVKLLFEFVKLVGIELFNGSHLLVKFSLVYLLQTAFDLLCISLSCLLVFGSFADSYLHAHQLILGCILDILAKVGKLLLDESLGALIDLLDVLSRKLLVEIAAGKSLSEL